MSRSRDTFPSDEEDAASGAMPSVDTAPPQRDLRRLRRRRMVIVAIILSVSAMIQWHRHIGLSLAGHWYAMTAEAPSINVAEAVDLIDRRDALVFDVRDPREWETSHLQGAERLDFKDIKAGRLPESARRDRPIIVYCTIGYRSGMAAKMLTDRGFDARNLRGGILALAQASAPLVAADGPTRKVHTWSEKFAWLLAPDHEAVWDAADR